MKKVISVVLALVMLLSFVPMISANAVFYNGMMADMNYGISVNEDNPLEYRAFYPNKSGYYSFYSNDGIYCDPFVYCYDENHKLLGFDDNNGGKNNFNYVAYLEEGKTYYFEIGANRLYSDTRFNVYITNVDSRMHDIKVGETAVVSPNYKRTIEYFKVVPETSGYYGFYSKQRYAFTNAVLYDSNFRLIEEDDDSGLGASFYLSHYLEAGQTYYYMSSSGHDYDDNDYEVCFEPCEVITDINIISYPEKMTYYHGYIEDTKTFSGLSAELVYTDGSTVLWTYAGDSWEAEIVGTTVYTDIAKDEDGQYYIYVAADEAYERFDINVIDCPVKSIEVVSHSKVECYENMSGWDFVDQVNKEHFFVYHYELPRDLMIRINYEDGTSVETSYFQRYDNMRFMYTDNQRKGERWSLGKNPVIIKYFDKECVMYVDVVENPIKSLTLKKAPSKVYMFQDTSVDDNSVHYEFTTKNLKGIEFDVNYKDGTTQTITDEDVTYDNGGYIGAYPYYTGTYSVDKPQKVLVALSYCGHKIFYEVFVVERGDVDCDFTVSVMDATKIQKMLSENATISSDIKLIANVDFDSSVSVLDATQIQRYVAGMINGFER